MPGRFANISRATWLSQRPHLKSTSPADTGLPDSGSPVVQVITCAIKDRQQRMSIRPMPCRKLQNSTKVRHQATTRMPVWSTGRAGKHEARKGPAAAAVASMVEAGQG